MTMLDGRWGAWADYDEEGETPDLCMGTMDGDVKICTCTGGRESGNKEDARAIALRVLTAVNNYDAVLGTLRRIAAFKKDGEELTPEEIDGGIREEDGRYSLSVDNAFDEIAGVIDMARDTLNQIGEETLDR